MLFEFNPTLKSGELWYGPLVPPATPARTSHRPRSYHPHIPHMPHICVAFRGVQYRGKVSLSFSALAPAPRNGVVLISLFLGFLRAVVRCGPCRDRRVAPSTVTRSSSTPQLVRHVGVRISSPERERARACTWGKGGWGRGRGRDLFVPFWGASMDIRP